MPNVSKAAKFTLFCLGNYKFCPSLFQQESLDELKLVVGDTFENVASLQDCHFQQRDSVQTLGKSRCSCRGTAYSDVQMFPKKNKPPAGRSVGGRGSAHKKKAKNKGGLTEGRVA